VRHVYFILIDEFVDRTSKLHPIVYIYYLQRVGQSSPSIKFVELMPLVRDTRKSLILFPLKFTRKAWFGLIKLVAKTTNGTLCTVHIHQGIVVYLRGIVPHFMYIHCFENR